MYEKNKKEINPVMTIEGTYKPSHSECAETLELAARSSCRQPSLETSKT